LLLVIFFCAFGGAFLIAEYAVGQSGFFSLNYDATTSASTLTSNAPPLLPPPVLDKALYDAKIEELAHPLKIVSSSTASTTVATTTLAAATTLVATTTLATTTPSLWPAKTVYPNYGALLPFNRIVAYYGNFYTGALGVLGEYPPQEMLSMLLDEAAKWQAADPSTPVIPALDYIAVTAQGAPGIDGKYRLRMPADQIEEAITLANQINGIVILDIQVGQSNVEAEVPLLGPYLKLPNVELALDPEFSMKAGQRPSTVIGTMDASDINYAAQYLAGIVRENNLPPKILVVHRFTEAMVTNSQNITPLPEVQIVMDMDGFGTPAQKTKVYRQVIYNYPVQFTGLKLFYKNDLLPPSSGLMTDAAVLRLTPQPSFIQYQ
jgi:hypothetical protein